MSIPPTSGDHRAAYYRSYVSGFTAREAARDTSTDNAYRTWCEAHFSDWLCEVPRHGPVLELGAGDGAMLDFLQSRGFSDVAGIDISEEQAQLARRLGRTVRVQDAFEALTVPAGTLSGIVALDFIEHFSKAEVGELLRLAALALRPDGFLLIRTPNGQGLLAGQIIYGDLTHMTIFTPGSLDQALRLAGFEDIRFKESTFHRQGIRGSLRGVAWNVVRVCANAVRRVQTGKTQAIWSENLLCFARTGPRASR